MSINSRVFFYELMIFCNVIISKMISIKYYIIWKLIEHKFKKSDNMRGRPFKYFFEKNGFADCNDPVYCWANGECNWFLIQNTLNWESFRTTNFHLLVFGYFINGTEIRSWFTKKFFLKSTKHKPTKPSTKMISKSM